MAGWSRVASSTFALAAAAVLATACGSGPNPGHSAVADGVKFDYALAPAAAANSPHAYRLTLNLADAATGAAIDDANVAVNVFGPGYDGSELVNLSKGAAAAGGYGGDVLMPQAGAYRLTFQVNRKPPAASAVAVFEARPPA